MSAVASWLSVHVEQVHGFEFRVTFDKEQFVPLLAAAPSSCGEAAPKVAARIVAAAIGNCLAASLLFCLGEQKALPDGVTADVDVEILRTEGQQLRVGTVNVNFTPSADTVFPRSRVIAGPWGTSATHGAGAVVV